MMRCPNCAFENADGMAFCGKCGTGLNAGANAQSTEEVAGEVAEVKCPKCGSTMPGTAAFCGVCGGELRSSDTPSRSATSGRADSTVGGPATDSVGSTVDYSGCPAADTGERREVEAELKSPEGSIREMVLIPAGWFAIGSPAEVGNQDEHPLHQVELASYYVDRCAVSNLEYERFDPRHRRLRPEVADGDRDPVVFVSYQDCLNYCRWRAEQEGVPPGTYSLPTEAQWESAARGGYPDRMYPWGDKITPEACNTLEVGRGRTVPVDEGHPNGFGLFHVGSNVREWCLDYYSGNYYGTLEATGPDPSGPRPLNLVNMNVVRGASFQDAAKDLGRCAARNYAHPNSSSSDIGFRCVRMLR